MNKKIIVGLSGGIDSSMSLWLLKQQGWEPIGVSLNMPVYKGRKTFVSAQKVCQKLKVPHYIIDVKKDFKKEVLDYFVRSYQDGQTPNPCVICNRHIKFLKLFEFAKKMNVKHVASGHYARVREVKSSKLSVPSYQLLLAKDKTKDQTYNLCFLKKEWLQYLVFPLGNYTKKEVYQMAKKQGFAFLTKLKQSQDFCYLANNNLDKFLQTKIKASPGKIVDERGNILGKHNGLHFYTLGQRKGIKINNGPWFVKKIDPLNNLLLVTKNKKEVAKKEVYLSPFNFITFKIPTKPIKVLARVRYRQPLAPALLYPPLNNQLKLVFNKPQLAVTPGQFAVFYLGEVCLGSGNIIE